LANAAVQAQDFHTPAYSETELTGVGFGLSYAAMNGTDTRSELGARFDDPTLLYGKPLILFSRVAWHDSALTSAGAELWLTANWSLIAKFDGEFAPGSQTYAGSGTLRYTW
jgi:uncharacterized protein with beta-barrel porin domain